MPWDGNEETDFAPVSGKRIEEFIKNSLNSKMGLLYYDASNNRYLVFADEYEKDSYLQDPTKTNLILGNFDAPFNYTAEISLLSSTHNTVFIKDKGNYIDFTFDIKNKQDKASTGEDVTVTYTFIRNAHKKIVTETRRFGEAVHFNVDDYIETGTNTIIIGVTGQTTLASTTVSVTYQVVDFVLTDELDISNVHDLSKGDKTIEVFFTVKGEGIIKTVEWFLDGAQITPVTNEDDVFESSASRTKYITLSSEKLSSGVHSLQIRAYTHINGEKFYTDTLYRELLVDKGDVVDNFLAVAATLPRDYGIVNDDNPLVLYGAEQYLPYEIRFAARKSSNIGIYLGSTHLTTVEVTRGAEMTYSVVSSEAGTLILSLLDGEQRRDVSFVVNKTSLNINEITNALVFDFSARGRSNASIDKDVWKYGEFTASFEGFNWNASSGWVNNALLINKNAKFSVDIAPLHTDATSVGKTLEFEFSTRNVEDDNAVLCDLTTNGVGLVITASGVTLTSAAGETVSTKFKSGEVNRIAFVINRRSGVTYKNLAFVYVNGILSGATNYGSADKFTSSAYLTFNGTSEAQIELRAMRFYDTALTSDNILNNYILYRDTLTEMLDIYYRNEVYNEGTQEFSPYMVQRRLPVMIITGDVQELEGATTTSAQILVDIEYTNEQDPAKNFRMSNAALRIQGTSSLTYPRKNFRFYTTKEESTVVYDANGNVVTDKLYAFKDGAQPVDCWCLKADYAESSGTHNTGIARIWNKVMYGAIVKHKNILGEEVNGYVLRTGAQIAALESGYPYDVRTTIDGFPIALFYKNNASDTKLVFLGKYNFNNDKSTPSVFGFEGIPGFNNSNMQCWETKDNGHPLGLFTDVSSFDTEWSEAFESRYPDKPSPETKDLKKFSIWINGVSQEKFATEKWEHLDVYKVAAYYCYLMRFGAVDQTVKNGFLTSEDGDHFYYINYDNDTINGLINIGELRLDPTINRQTIGSDGKYVYAGHSSVLWNRCEADAEFMEIVSIVDNALYTAGLKYDDVIKEFNDKQADKWVERIYNQDAEYKYLLPFVNSTVDNLFMLQGSRSSHRSWWLSKRFALYDSLFVSGRYKDINISFKCSEISNVGFRIIAGTDMEYGYGINSGNREVGIALSRGESYDFNITDTLNYGDVVKIYAAANLNGIILDPSIIPSITVFECAAAVDPVLGTKLENLTLGNSSVSNNQLSSISGLGNLTSLKSLNIEGYVGIKELNLTNQKNLTTLNTQRSGVSSIDFAPGAPITSLSLSPLTKLKLDQLPLLTSKGITMPFSTTTTIEVLGCPNVSNDFSLIKQWIENKTTPDVDCTLIMDNINWNNVTPADLIKVGQLGTINLKGKVELTEISEEYVNTLSDIFGADSFDKNAEFYIDAPISLYIQGPTTLLEGESATYKLVLFGGEIIGPPIWGPIQIDDEEGIKFHTTTQYLETIETGKNRSITLTLSVVIDEGSYNTELTVSVKARTYPSSDYTNIIGDSSLGESGEIAKDENVKGGSIYKLEITNDVTGEYNVEWDLSGLEGYALTKKLPEDMHYYIIWITSYPDIIVTGTITVSIYKKSTGSLLFTKTKTIELINENIAELDPGICAAFYDTFHDSGWISNKSYITKNEALSFTEEHLQSGTNSNTSLFASYTSQIESFKGFKYFTNVKKIKPNTFSNCSSLTSITIPDSVTEIGNSAFIWCSSLKSITIPDSVTSIGNIVFSNCTSLESVSISYSVTSIGSYAFQNCSSLTSITIGNSVTTIGISAFSGCSSLTSVTIPGSITSIGDSAFSSCINLNIITCKALTAPKVYANTFGYSNSTYTGYNTRGKNVLCVPDKSTGYETEQWFDTLCNADKCGFTLSKTLL